MYVALSAQVSWIRQRDVHILTMGGVVYTSDPRVAVSHSGDLWDELYENKSSGKTDSQ